MNPAMCPPMGVYLPSPCPPDRSDAMVRSGHRPASSVDAAIAARPVAVADVALEHLARTRPGQLGQELHGPRALVAGDELVAVRAELVLRDLCAGAQDDGGVHALAPPVVRDADHRGLEHGRVLAERVLDLDR